MRNLSWLSYNDALITYLSTGISIKECKAEDDFYLFSLDKFFFKNIFLINLFICRAEFLALVCCWLMALILGSFCQLHAWYSIFHKCKTCLMLSGLSGTCMVFLCYLIKPILKCRQMNCLCDKDLLTRNCSLSFYSALTIQHHCSP